MALFVKNVLLLDYAKELKLIAGKNGLENLITTVGILDHEIIENKYDVFQKGEFVITTLSVARDDDSLVFNAVKGLISKKVSGLAIKSIYYDNLPDYIKKYADDHAFPIFVFESIFIEHLIHTINDAIKSNLLHQVYETKLETLFKGDISKHLIRQVAYELNENHLDYHQVIYLKKKRIESEKKLIEIVDQFIRVTDDFAGHGLYKFRNGILIIMTFKQKDLLQSKLDFNYILKHLMITSSDYYIGRSMFYPSIDNLDTAIREAFISYETGIITNTDINEYDSIGIYKMLIPLLSDSWTINYCKEILEPILDYDFKHDTNLYDTVKLYFDLGCNTKSTAEQLFQHKNTILYRIKKIKELAGPFKNDLDFNTQLSLSIKINEARYQSPIRSKI